MSICISVDSKLNFESYDEHMINLLVMYDSLRIMVNFKICKFQYFSLYLSKYVLLIYDKYTR